MSKALGELRDMSPARRIGVGTVLAASLALVGIAQRDLQRRPASDLRGPKVLWRLVCLNAFGAVAYLSWGRHTAG
jgi:hypothetical protein